MAGPVSQQAAFSIAEAGATPAFVSKPAATPGRVDPWCRAIAWGAMIAGSMVPMIFGRSAGEDGYSVPVAQVLILVIAAIILNRSSRLRPLSGFLLTIAILRLGWSVIAPVLGDWAPVQSLMN